MDALENGKKAEPFSSIILTWINSEHEKSLSKLKKKNRGGVPKWNRGRRGIYIKSTTLTSEFIIAYNTIEQPTGVGSSIFAEVIYVVKVKLTYLNDTKLHLQ